MPDVRVELNGAGVQALLHAPGVGAHARAVAERAAAGVRATVPHAQVEVTTRTTDRVGARVSVTDGRPGAAKRLAGALQAALRSAAG